MSANVSSSPYVAGDANPISFAIYQNCTSTSPIQMGDVPWGTLPSRMKRRSYRKEKDGVAISFVKLKDGTTRANSNVEHVSAIALDVDDGTPFAKLLPSISDVEFVAYSTYSHTEAHEKYRIIFRLTHNVRASEWTTVWQGANLLVGNHADPSTKDIARIFYLPSCPVAHKDAAFFVHNPGRPLDPEDLIRGTEAVPSPPVKIEAPNDNDRFSRICKDGERTAHLTSLVGTLLQRSLPHNEIIARCRAWNSKNGPPLLDEKIVSTCRSMAKTHARNCLERTMPVGQMVEDFEPLFSIESARVNRYLVEPPAPRRMLLVDCLPFEKVGAIIAPGGTGKSQLVLQIAASVAADIPLAGQWEVGEPGAVLCLFGEDDEEEIHRRVHTTTQVLTNTYPDLPIRERLRENLFLKSMVAVNNLMTIATATGEVRPTNYVDRLYEVTKDILNLKLIVIDPASRFRGGNENAAEDTTRFIEAAERISKLTGATVVIVHHANKSSMQGADQSQSASRGSSAFTDGVRWQMNLAPMTVNEAKKYAISDDRRGMYLSASITKNNYAPPQSPVMLMRSRGGYLIKAPVIDRAVQQRNDLMRRVVKLIIVNMDSDIGLSATAFESKYGGTNGLLEAGKVSVRTTLSKAIDAGYVKKSPPKGHLAVTALGQGFCCDDFENEPPIVRHSDASRKVDSSRFFGVRTKTYVR